MVDLLILYVVNALIQTQFHYNAGISYLFQDGVVWAIHTQLPDLMVVCHNEEGLFSWNEEQVALEDK